MKIFVVLLVLCVAEIHCGLVNNLIENKDNKKPDLINKIVQNLENGTTIIEDAFGSRHKANQTTAEDKKLKDGLPLVIDDVCVIEDDPKRCV
ncbi:unnamed protein product [Arctia plantaginis]|uniref:Uncharacterized protein n=1 Tax=Arctia plantaginis TaxID=874455 RepID=A0A8S0Z8Q6_ARCPL|nr:unnamed protein product [Arctia plantaginis]